MDDLVRVQLVDCLADLPHDGCHLGLRHRLQFLQLLEQLVAHGQFHEEIDIDVVVEEPVEADDVGVVEERLDFEFARELFGDVLFQQKFLLNDLDGAYEI